MNQYQLILYDIEDPTEFRLSAIEDIVYRLSGGNRSIISARLQNLPAVIGDRLTAEQIESWQAALNGAGVRMEVTPPLGSLRPEAPAATAPVGPSNGKPGAELKFDLGDLDEIKKQVAKPEATAPQGKTSKPAAAAEPKSAGAAAKQVKKPATKDTASTPAPQAGAISRAPTGSTRRPVASASVKATKKDNKIIRNSGSFPVQKSAANDEPLVEKPAPSEAAPGVQSAPAAAPKPMTASGSALEAVPAAKRSPILLVGLVVGFLVLPVFFLMLPENSAPTMKIDESAVQKLLQQQQKMLDEINSNAPEATPIPTEVAPSTQEWALHQEREREIIALDVETEVHGMRSVKLALKGRKFWPLLQYDPKQSEQAIIFVREITAEAYSADPTAVLRGKGEALITSGTYPYRIELDVAVTSRVQDGVNTVTFEVTDSKYGGLQNSAEGVVNVAPGEYRMSMKKTFQLRKKGDNSAPDGAKETPTPVSKGSYQRIPMEVPKVLATPEPRRRR